MTLAVLVALGATLCGGLVVWQLRKTEKTANESRREHGKSVVAQKPNADVTRLETGLRALQARVAVVEHSKHDNSPAKALPNALPVAEAQLGPDPKELEHEELTRVHQGHDELLAQVALTQFDEIIRAGVRAADLERETRQSLLDLLAKPEFEKSTAQRIECTEHLCKIAIAHSSRKAREEFMRSSGLSRPPFSSDFFFSFDPETSVTMVYLTMNGYPFPKVDTQEGVTP